jgi:ABC-2 type transport system ATP-binding protein
MQPSVAITHLSVTLGKNFAALKDVSVELPSSQITGIIGPSGAGKTTLIRTIVGRQKITQGNVQVLGRPAGSASLRHRLHYMTQEISVYDDLTVRENLRYFATMSGQNRSAVKEAVTEVLRTVDMQNHANQLVSDLSGGQKQRVSLAVALLGRPELLVLDEPTVGLDPVLREQLWQLFHELTGKGTTVIISSHVMDEAERCDDLLLIRDGQLLAHDTPAELCRQNGTKTVEQSFLKLVGAPR